MAMLALPLPLAALVALSTLVAAEPSAAGSCSGATATTLQVSWAEEPLTDLYYVQLSDPSITASTPYALQTTAMPSMTLIDLVPDTEYTLSVRSHPSDFNIVWGWRLAGASFKCKTTAERADAPSQLRRVGDSPHESEIALRWSPVDGAAAHAVGTRLADEGGAWRWEPADTPAAHTARSLASGQRYEVAVRDEATGIISEPLLMRTAAPGVIYTAPYRISEYTFDVDFLQNHDTGTKESIAIYVQNGGGYSEADVSTPPT